MSRAALVVVAAVAIAGSLLACGLEQLTSGGQKDAGASASASDAAAADANLTGAGCGVDGETGTTLCRATSQCASVVVDSQAFPHCGFRIKGATSELVCVCGESICSMGAFTTCTQAAQLLSAQTEAQICTQVAEGRCTGAASTSSSSSSSSSGSTCDRDCLSQCGGGAGCASICGC